MQKAVRCMAVRDSTNKQTFGRDRLVGHNHLEDRHSADVDGGEGEVGFLRHHQPCGAVRATPVRVHVGRTLVHAERHRSADDDQFQTGLPAPPRRRRGHRSREFGRVVQGLGQLAERLVAEKPRDDARPEPARKVRHDVEPDDGDGRVRRRPDLLLRRRRNGCRADGVVARQQRRGQEQFAGVRVEC